MRLKKDNFCLTIYGNIMPVEKKWSELYKALNELFLNLQFPPNYFAIDSKEYSTTTVKKIDPRNEKKLRKVFNGKCEIKTFQLLSLPDNCKQAIFDFSVYFVVYKGEKIQHITFAIKKVNFKIAKLELIKKMLSKYMTINKGEIYKISYEESVFFYAMKSKSIESYKGLEIIKQF